MDSALCRIFLLNAKCTEMGSSLVPTLNKTHEDTKNKKIHKRQGKLGRKHKTFCWREVEQNLSKGQNQYDQ